MKAELIATGLLLVGALLLPLITAGPASAADKSAGITHTPLLNESPPGSLDTEVTVWDTFYPPQAANPRHKHPSAITFYVLSGTGVWKEDGKPAVTLKAGDSLFAPAGTIHAHWNPSPGEPLRFLEFIASPKGQGRPIREGLPPEPN